MCGIGGIWNRNGEPVEPVQIDLLDQSLVHRGPDGAGRWQNKDLTLAFVHRRLSILDLSDAASQPMHYADGRFVIVFNGEIYNFIEIRNELSKKGYTFKTESDTEVILAAYTEWREKMLHRFNGMWAIAIYDTATETLFLSRDRFAVKPLYYYSDESTFAFASEVQALHKLLGNKALPDQIVLNNISNAGFLNHGTARTYLKNVFSLPGGYNTIISKEKFYLVKWYEMLKQEVPRKLDQQALYLKELLIDSCKLRLRSDVPVATCLSGGVDSGSITALIQVIQDRPSENRFKHYSHKSFLASFPGSTIDERFQAEQLSDKIGNELNVINIQAPSQHELEDAMNHCDGPMHSLAFYPIWKLYKEIKSNGITVTLDGQGPDEMMGGYRQIHSALMSAFRLNKMFWGIDVYKIYSAQGESRDFSSKKYVLDALRFVMKEKIKANLKGRRLKYLNSNFSSELSPVRKETLFNDPFNDDMYYHFFYNPLPAILNQYDRCSMASGVECRMPFMDYRLVEYIFSLPLESKVGGGFTKRVLRDAMKGILPDSTRLNKIKIGFNAPVVDWFRGPLKTYLLDTMNSNSFLHSNYFNGKRIRSGYELFLKSPGGKNDFYVASEFWPAVHINYWLNKFNLS